MFLYEENDQNLLNIKEKKTPKKSTVVVEGKSYILKVSFLLQLTF